MSKKEIDTYYLMKYIKDEQDSFVIKTIMDKMNKKFSEATKMWFASKTRDRIQQSKVESVKIASPARCFDELQKEMTNNPMWMHCPF